MNEIDPKKVRDAIIALHNAGEHAHARTVWDLWDLVQFNLGKDSAKAARPALLDLQAKWQQNVLGYKLSDGPAGPRREAFFAPPGFPAAARVAYGSATEAADPCACPECGSTKNPHECSGDDE